MSGPSARASRSATVSVVICAYTAARWALLSASIDSVLRQNHPADEIVLVVDHAPELFTRAEMAFPDVLVVPNDEAQGLSGARNTGVRRSAGEIIAFLDDDATAQPDWLERLVGAFDEPAVMGAGGLACPVWEGPRPSWLPQEFLWVVGASYEGLPKTSAPVRNPIGANMAFRREAFERAGSFTDGIGRVSTRPMGCEETEFSIRLRQAVPDAVVLHVPQARVDHHISRDRATWRYFLSRCWAEGASKALVTAIVGGTDGLSSERSYVGRTLPLGVLAGLGATGRGDPGGVARSAAIVAGLGVTTAGFVAGRVASRSLRRPPTDDATPFAPLAVRSVELAEPLTEITAQTSPSGDPYGSAFVLVRLHGAPLGVETIPLVEGRADAEQLAELLWSAVGPRIVARAAAADQPLAEAGSQLLLRGLDGIVSSPPARLAATGSAPHVTVVVPTRYRHAELERCLRSLKALRYPHFDIVVVDNAPADPICQTIVAAHAEDRVRIRYTAEPRPGSSVARNHGMARTTADFVAFSDDDVVVDPDWLDALMEPLLRDPGIDVATGLVLPAELETWAQRCFEQYRGFGRGFEERVFAADAQGSEHRFLHPYWGGPFGTGTSMAFRRSALRAIGGFDPALGAGSLARSGSDVEAFSHLLLRGGRLAYQPGAICWHTHRREESQLRRQLLDYGVGLTAILTKWCIRHPPLLWSILRAVPTALAGAPAARPGQRPGLPKYLRRLEMRGYLLGPLLYLRSVRWARRLKLDAVIADAADELAGP